MAFISLRSITLTAVFAAVALAAPAAQQNPIEGYTIVPATWELDGPDGQVIQLNGTIQEVVDQLDVLVPGSRDKLVVSIAASFSSSAMSRREEESPLEKRYEETNLLCWVKPWSDADLSAIQNGINYLNGVSGRPWHDPGPGTCARVSCSDDSAIYWCNDNRHRKALDSYKNIAHGADRIKNTCRIIYQLGTGITNGQIFYKDNWNVIVRGDNC